MPDPGTEEKSRRELSLIKATEVRTSQALINNALRSGIINIGKALSLSENKQLTLSRLVRHNPKWGRKKIQILLDRFGSDPLVYYLTHSEMLKIIEIMNDIDSSYHAQPPPNKP